MSNATLAAAVAAAAATATAASTPQGGSTDHGSALPTEHLAGPPLTSPGSAIRVDQIRTRSADEANLPSEVGLTVELDLYAFADDSCGAMRYFLVPTKPSLKKPQRSRKSNAYRSQVFVVREVRPVPIEGITPDAPRRTPTQNHGTQPQPAYFVPAAPYRGVFVFSPDKNFDTRQSAITSESPTWHVTTSQAYLHDGSPIRFIATSNGLRLLKVVHLDVSAHHQAQHAFTSSSSTNRARPLPIQAAGFTRQSSSASSSSSSSEDSQSHTPSTSQHSQHMNLTCPDVAWLSRCAWETVDMRPDSELEGLAKAMIAEYRKPLLSSDKDASRSPEKEDAARKAGRPFMNSCSIFIIPPIDRDPPAEAGEPLEDVEENPGSRRLKYAQSVPQPQQSQQYQPHQSNPRAQETTVSPIGRSSVLPKRSDSHIPSTYTVDSAAAHAAAAAATAAVLTISPASHTIATNQADTARRLNQIFMTPHYPPQTTSYSQPNFSGVTYGLQNPLRSPDQSSSFAAIPVGASSRHPSTSSAYPQYIGPVSPSNEPLRWNGMNTAQRIASSLGQLTPAQLPAQVATPLGGVGPTPIYMSQRPTAFAKLSEGATPQLQANPQSRALAAMPTDIDATIRESLSPQHTLTMRRNPPAITAAVSISSGALADNESSGSNIHLHPPTDNAPISAPDGKIVKSPASAVAPPPTSNSDTLASVRDRESDSQEATQPTNRRPTETSTEDAPASQTHDGIASTSRRDEQSKPGSEGEAAGADYGETIQTSRTHDAPASSHEGEQPYTSLPGSQSARLRIFNPSPKKPPPEAGLNPAAALIKADTMRKLLSPSFTDNKAQDNIMPQSQQGAKDTTSDPPTTQRSGKSRLERILEIHRAQPDFQKSHLVTGTEFAAVSNLPQEETRHCELSQLGQVVTATVERCPAPTNGALQETYFHVEPTCTEHDGLETQQLPFSEQPRTRLRDETASVLSRPKVDLVAVADDQLENWATSDRRTVSEVSSTKRVRMSSDLGTDVYSEVEQAYYNRRPLRRSLGTDLGGRDSGALANADDERRRLSPQSLLVASPRQVAVDLGDTNSCGFVGQPAQRGPRTIAPETRTVARLQSERCSTFSDGRQEEYEEVEYLENDLEGSIAERERTFNSASAASFPAPAHASHAQLTSSNVHNSHFQSLNLDPGKYLAQPLGRPQPQPHIASHYTSRASAPMYQPPPRPFAATPQQTSGTRRPSSELTAIDAKAETSPALSHAQTVFSTRESLPATIEGGNIRPDIPVPDYESQADQDDHRHYRGFCPPIPDQNGGLHGKAPDEAPRTDYREYKPVPPRSLPARSFGPADHPGWSASSPPSHRQGSHPMYHPQMPAIPWPLPFDEKMRQSFTAFTFMMYEMWCRYTQTSPHELQEYDWHCFFPFAQYPAMDPRGYSRGQQHQQYQQAMNLRHPGSHAYELASNNPITSHARLPTVHLPNQGQLDAGKGTSQYESPTDRHIHGGRGVASDPRNQNRVSHHNPSGPSPPPPRELVTPPPVHSNHYMYETATTADTTIIDDVASRGAPSSMSPPEGPKVARRRTLHPSYHPGGFDPRSHPRPGHAAGSVQSSPDSDFSASPASGTAGSAPGATNSSGPVLVRPGATQARVAVGPIGSRMPAFESPFVPHVAKRPYS